MIFSLRGAIPYRYDTTRLRLRTHVDVQVSIPYRYDTTTVFKPFLHRLSIQIVKNDVNLLPKVCQPLSSLYPKSKQNQAFSDICQFLHLVSRLFAQFFLFFPSKCIIFSYQISLQPLYFLALEVDRLAIHIQEHCVEGFYTKILIRFLLDRS